MIPEQRLWQSVVFLGISEGDQAWFWSEEFELCCSLAGLDPNAMRLTVARKAKNALHAVLDGATGGSIFAALQTEVRASSGAARLGSARKSR